MHPVVLMGRWCELTAGWVPPGPPDRARSRGSLAWGLGALLAGLGGGVAGGALRRLPVPARHGARGALLWPLLSLRMLLEEVAAVETALAHCPAEGRRRLARLVSRPTDGLAPTAVREAALESLAENLSDGVVAPLVWYALGGLPAAALYRYVNTADAMWGYPTPRWRDAGRTAALVDDGLNLVPARLTAALLAPPRAWDAVRRDAVRTDSPNAGWPMAALAHRLDVRLGKTGAYLLNGDARTPGPGDTARALRIGLGVGLGAGLATALVTSRRG